MEYKWIKKIGSCSNKDIISIIKANLHEDCVFLAGCTDTYISGRDGLETFLKEKVDDLLELRVFSEEREILFTRSMIDSKFQWRLTDDEALERTDYLDTEQFIDINTNSSFSKGEGGMMRICTTVGGWYSLPIKAGQNAVKIRSYITYDQYGMASVTDHRVCGFIKK